MNILLHQPGKVGDIINCLPIAKWYADMGDTVTWLCPEKYHTLFNYVDYATPVARRAGRYDRLIDLSFGLVTGTSLHAAWLRYRQRGKSFVQFKYELAEVPLDELRNLVYERNHQAEQELFDIVTDSAQGDYNLCHRVSDYGRALDWPDGTCIDFSPKSHYTIFDWRKTIENAAEIHCIDSSLCNFVDAVETPAQLYYYITDRVPLAGDRTILTKNWQTRYVA